MSYNNDLVALHGQPSGYSSLGPPPGFLPRSPLSPPPGANYQLMQRITAQREQMQVAAASSYAAEVSAQPRLIYRNLSAPPLNFNALQASARIPPPPQPIQPPSLFPESFFVDGFGEYFVHLVNGGRLLWPLKDSIVQNITNPDGTHYKASSLNASEGLVQETDPEGRTSWGRYYQDQIETIGYEEDQSETLGYKLIFSGPITSSSENVRFALYSGRWLNGRPDGFGKLTLEDNSVVTGVWSNGILVGSLLNLK